MSSSVSFSWNQSIVCGAAETTRSQSSVHFLFERNIYFHRWCVATPGPVRLINERPPSNTYLSSSLLSASTSSHHNIFIIVSLVSTDRTYYVITNYYYFIIRCIRSNGTVRLCHRPQYIYFISYYSTWLHIRTWKITERRKPQKCFHLRLSMSARVCRMRRQTLSLNIETNGESTVERRFVRTWEQNSKKWNFIRSIQRVNYGEREKSQKRKIAFLVHSCCKLPLLLLMFVCVESRNNCRWRSNTFWWYLLFIVSLSFQRMLHFRLETARETI